MTACLLLGLGSLKRMETSNGNQTREDVSQFMIDMLVLANLTAKHMKWSRAMGQTAILGGLRTISST